MGQYMKKLRKNAKRSESYPIIGQALMQFNIDQKGDNYERIGYDLNVMISTEASTISYGDKETLYTSGDAIYAALFLINLFAAPEKFNVKQIADFAVRKGYKADYFKQGNGTYEEWFDDFHDNVGLTSKRIKPEEIVEDLIGLNKFFAHVILVDDAKYYGVEGLFGTHYIVLLGVDVSEETATIFNPKYGICTEDELDAIIESAVTVWRITD